MPGAAPRPGSGTAATWDGCGTRHRTTRCAPWSPSWPVEPLRSARNREVDEAYAGEQLVAVRRAAVNARIAELEGAARRLEARQEYEQSAGVRRQIWTLQQYGIALRERGVPRRSDAERDRPAASGSGRLRSPSGGGSAAGRGARPCGPTRARPAAVCWCRPARSGCL